jgi:hypothetical protein
MLRAEITRLHGLLGIRDVAGATPTFDPTLSVPPGGLTLFEDETPGLAPVDAKSSAVEKIALFRTLFAGRDDVYALRWANPRPGRRPRPGPPLRGSRRRTGCLIELTTGCAAARSAERLLASPAGAVTSVTRGSLRL